MKGFKFILVLSCILLGNNSIPLSYAGVVWERHLKLSGYGSLDSSLQRLSLRAGVDLFSDVRYGVKARWFTISRIRYEEIFQSGSRSKGIDEAILSLIYLNYFNRFLYWKTSISHWTPFSSFGDLILNESTLTIGLIHSRRLTGEYGFQMSKFIRPDGVPIFWLTPSWLLSMPIGWRGRSSLAAQFQPKLNISDITHFSATFVLGYEYKFTDRWSVKFEDVVWYDSKDRLMINHRGTIDLFWGFY